MNGMSSEHFGMRQQLRAEGLKRRQALVTGGCATYRLSRDHTGEPRSIHCLCCGITSYNSNDIVNLYCAVCAAYQSDWLSDPYAPPPDDSVMQIRHVAEPPPLEFKISPTTYTQLLRLTDGGDLYINAKLLGLSQDGTTVYHLTREYMQIMLRVGFAELLEGMP